MMIKKFVYIMILLPSMLIANTGHRLGKGAIKGYPENTLEILSKALEADIHHKKGFKYWEFDTRETRDNRLVVHHNREIKNTDLRIDNTNYDIIREIKLGGCCTIPNVSEVLMILEEGYIGKVAIEIKNLHSNKARDDLAQQISRYNSKNNLKIVAIATRSHFNKSFPEELKRVYCPLFKIISKVGEHKTNLCKRYLE